jgi:hypothetical protein
MVAILAVAFQSQIKKKGPGAAGVVQDPLDIGSKTPAADRALEKPRRGYLRFSADDFFKRTPGPPPFSSMDSTPARRKEPLRDGADRAKSVGCEPETKIIAIALNPVGLLDLAQLKRWGISLVLRSLVICLAWFLLTACNELSGDENGGVIDNASYRGEGAGQFDAYLPQRLLDFRDRHVPTTTALLEMANSHCLRYGKQARITKIGSKGIIMFECM